jgi:hypothetical protein
MANAVEERPGIAPGRPYVWDAELRMAHEFPNSPTSDRQFNLAWKEAPKVPQNPSDDIAEGWFVDYDVVYDEDLLYAPAGVDLFEEGVDGQAYSTPLSEEPTWMIADEGGEGYRGLTYPEFQKAAEIEVFARPEEDNITTATDDVIALGVDDGNWFSRRMQEKLHE